MLYEGILEFIQRADLFGNIINGLPIIGALRVQVLPISLLSSHHSPRTFVCPHPLLFPLLFVLASPIHPSPFLAVLIHLSALNPSLLPPSQMISAARDRLTLVLGDQLIKFLGEYSTSAAEGAVEFALSDENKPYFRKARRRLGKRLLETPISKLVALNQLEMAILRDSIWAAVREFRLPNEVRSLILDARVLAHCTLAHACYPYSHHHHTALPSSHNTRQAPHTPLHAVNLNPCTKSNFNSPPPSSPSKLLLRRIDVLNGSLLD